MVSISLFFLYENYLKTQFAVITVILMNLNINMHNKKTNLKYITLFAFGKLAKLLHPDFFLVFLM